MPHITPKSKYGMYEDTFCTQTHKAHLVPERDSLAVVLVACSKCCCCSTCDSCSTCCICSTCSGCCTCSSCGVCSSAFVVVLAAAVIRVVAVVDVPLSNGIIEQFSNDCQKLLRDCDCYAY